ncbi:aldo/keto reductase [Lactobacillus gasseri]|uniref:2,5-diketo-D-gluconic acid reductase n=3 Tax=Lactobacillus gasseri TaxID=1596 RepID=A0A833FIF9_LACGS|nr:aldo/keto reductase [Lactobacillus gasseri]EFB61554.1 oxidoreductase, aldo/keto reductase family protein [Lactobacillus gasseri 224-1]EJN53446.1 Oxidoreductase, aldo/keto reductase family protein [Lactobacillus gasseri CECT 5714]KAB1950238.1 aldo/keto reductase [Lactobacillus gasseri]KFL96571.1 2,5-didehydrogluconate reductase [Lactobacillus gasseri SV-16A-US]MBS5223483.1 aldo/keto reductase [Lactobacillus gasseri]
MEYFNLNDGNRIPKIGFGTYKLNGSRGVFAIQAALKNGYRLLDSAVNYENEGAVGRAIKNSHVSRDKIFVTSKLPGRHHKYQEALEQIQESLYSANLDYYDLYLIHWPNPKENHYLEAWQAMIDAQRFGLIRSVGVSNFEPEHIEYLYRETGVMPAVNQVELHPYWSSKKVREYDNQHHIITEAWSPLQRGGEAFQEKEIIELAQKYHKSPAQIILRWETQINVVPIPKASSYEHQLSNLDIFDFKLAPEEVQSLINLDKESARRFDPNEHEEF